MKSREEHGREFAENKPSLGRDLDEFSKEMARYQRDKVLLEVLLDIREQLTFRE